MTDTPVDQDVVDILTTDHHEVLDLLQQIKITTDAEERRDLADTVISELVRHSVAEEMYVYPAMQKYLPDGDEAVDHDVEEHKELEQTMKKLESVDAQSGEFAQLLGELEDILRDHVSDEENEQFPELRVQVPREELIEIGARWRTRRSWRRPGRIHQHRTMRFSISLSAQVSVLSIVYATN
jgi:Hemerythrin HHE cation binding domain